METTTQGKRLNVFQMAWAACMAVILRLAVALCALFAHALCAPMTDHRLASVSVLSNYIRARQRFIQEEQNRFLGSQIKLSAKEKHINDGLMYAKRTEMTHPPKGGFPPSRLFISAKNDIEESTVFDFVRHIPKGAALHGHDLAMTSIDWVIANVTYRPHLFVRGISPEHRVNGAPMEFKFMPDRQGGRPGDKVAPGDWHRLSTVRYNSGNIPLFDRWLKEQLSLEVDDFQNRFKNVGHLWAAFEQRFGMLFSLLTYKPVFKDYFRQTLQEFMDDNVQYVELRVMLPEVYEDGSNVLGPVEVAEIYANVTKEFVYENGDRFFGARIIYAPHRSVPPTKIQSYAETFKEIKEKLVDFVIGFDLVGHEDTGTPLIDFAGELLAMAPNTKFFFHAGETDDHGMTDENLIDAVLLNASRIGHGYALTTHPLVMEEMKRRDIAVEVNPVSNQVLRLVSDLRNHPAGSLFSSNSVPVVVGSDDPGMWGARGLSYDWYEAFVGIASLHSDLRFLKQLALNSIRYSALAPADRSKLMALWMKQWNVFVEKMSKPDKNLMPNELYA